MISENGRQTGRSLFWRLWLRSLTVKRPQAALAVAALLVGATVASMLLNLYGDVRRKMTLEFRAYGPNLLIGPAASTEGKGTPASVATVVGLMDERVMKTLAHVFDDQHPNGVTSIPVLFAVTAAQRVAPDDGAERTEDPENVVAVGANFQALREMNPSWRLSGVELDHTGGTSGDATCVVGAHLASRLRLGSGDSLDLSPIGNSPDHRSPQSYRVAAILMTGASEDAQVFVPLTDLQRLTDLEGKISIVELSVPGETAEVERAMGELGQAVRNLPGVEVRPIRQIVYSSGTVLETIRWVMLSLAGLILIIIALCVMATMTAIVLERRKDIAVMKSLGASDRLVMRLFLTEGATLGIIGGFAGFALGLALAHAMARKLFSVSLAPAGAGWWTLPTICLASMTLAVVATLFPVGMARGIRPAHELRGE